MDKRLMAVICLLMLSGRSPAYDPSEAQHAVIRVPSHGCSATVIDSVPGRSYILGCAHAYDREGREDMEHKRHVLNIPMPAGWRTTNPGARARLLYHENPDRMDLALIQLDDGPLPYVAPVAGPGYTPGRRVVSIGYDEMRAPPQVRPATLLDRSMSEWTLTFTREPPWHGRSGGSLIDLDTGFLIGVCSGYGGRSQYARSEDPRGGPGIYASHLAIRSFLERAGWRSPSQVNSISGGPVGVGGLSLPAGPLYGAQSQSPLAWQQPNQQQIQQGYRINQRMAAPPRSGQGLPPSPSPICNH